jgi:hypothetical protein
MIKYLPDAVVIAITAFFLWDVIRAYKATIGSTFQRIISALKNAAASMWTGFTVFVTLVIGWLAQAADFVNAPSVANALTTYGSPKVVAGIMIAAALLIEFSNRRNSTHS